MKKSLIMLIAAAALAVGCASTGPVQTPAQAVFAAKGSYNAALTVAVAYKRLPRCSDAQPAPCSKPELIAQLQKADNVAAAALDAAEAAVRTPLVGATATARALSAAQAALAALTAMVANLAVTK